MNLKNNISNSSLDLKHFQYYTYTAFSKCHWFDFLWFSVYNVCGNKWLQAKGLQSNHQNKRHWKFLHIIRVCKYTTYQFKFQYPYMQIKYNGDFQYDVNLINNTVCIKITRLWYTVICLIFKQLDGKYIKNILMAYIQNYRRLNKRQ